ncbi:MAG: hypothetical protein M9961_03800 [Ilumatobacteraceae bacterium]|nr:hypothetical protein [Ilumatobacteraceae bacterium]
MTSKNQKLIERAWPKIEAAVLDAVKESGSDKLGRIATVRSRPAELSAHVRLSWSAASPGGLAERTLVATPDRVRTLSATFPSFNVSTIDPDVGDLGAHRQWAEEVRRDERRWLIHQLVAEASQASGAMTESDLTVGRRLIALRPAANLADQCADKGVELVDLKGLTWSGPTGAPVQPPCAALLLPTDRFGIARLEDFTLSWEVDDAGDITLTLEERIELIGFTGQPQADVTQFASIAPLPSP